MIIKRLSFLFIAALMGISGLFALYSPASQAYSSSRIIDDATFDNVNSMSETSIRSFINSRPGTCLVNMGSVFPEPQDYFNYNQGKLVDAARVIYVAAQAWGLNPQVILTTLQKEQSLLTDNDCYDPQGFSSLDKAMGMGCSEGGECPPPSYKYFEKQVMKGAWQLKFNKERAIGNIMWNGDENISYSVYYTRGNRQDTINSPALFRDGYVLIDGSYIFMETGATASLYRYTPHWPQSFPSIFESWFGNPNTPCLATSNVASTPSGAQVIAYQYGDGLTNLAFTQMNNTGSACVEAHIWRPGYQSWLSNIATGMRASNPAGGALIAMKPPGSSHSGLVYVTYSGVGGVVEVHRFSPDLRKFPGFYDVPTNLGGVVNPSTGTFVAGDFLGRGYDQLAYVLYSGSDGNAEVHLFDRSLTKAIGFYDVPTNLGNVTATSGTFVAGNLLGRGDQLAYVLYGGGSGRVEVHTFNPSLTKAIGYQDISTNLPSFNPTQ